MKPSPLLSELPGRPYQLNMALDAPKLRGLSQTQRDTVLGALAGLFLKATDTAVWEDDDARDGRAGALAGASFRSSVHCWIQPARSASLDAAGDNATPSRRQATGAQASRALFGKMSEQALQTLIHASLSVYCR